MPPHTKIPVSLALGLLLVASVGKEAVGDMASSACSTAAHGCSPRRPPARRLHATVQALPPPCAPTGGSHPWFEPVSWQPRAFVAHNFASQEETDHIIKLAQPLVRPPLSGGKRAATCTWHSLSQTCLDCCLLLCLAASVCFNPTAASGLHVALTPASAAFRGPASGTISTHLCLLPQPFLPAPAAQAQHSGGCWRAERGGHLQDKLRHVHQVGLQLLEAVRLACLACLPAFWPACFLACLLACLLGDVRSCMAVNAVDASLQPSGSPA